MYVCSSQIELRDPTTDVENQSGTSPFQGHPFRTTVWLTSKVVSNLTLKLFASSTTSQYHITENWDFKFLVDGNIREWKEIGWFPFCLVSLP